MLETLVIKFAEHGTVGLIAALFIALYVRSLSRIDRLQELRVEDMKEQSKAYDDLSDKALSAIDRLRTAIDAQKSAVEIAINHLLRRRG